VPNGFRVRKRTIRPRIDADTRFERPPLSHFDKRTAGSRAMGGNDRNRRLRRDDTHLSTRERTRDARATRMISARDTSRCANGAFTSQTEKRIDRFARVFFKLRKRTRTDMRIRIPASR
jgi:hypothetical protein